MEPFLVVDVVHRWAVLVRNRARRMSQASGGTGLAGAGSELDGLFLGNSELAGLMRSYDWAHSAVGPPESWPQSLKTAVRIMLTSRHSARAPPAASCCPRASRSRSAGGLS